MITFTPLASSSKGNAYLVTAPGIAPLLIECGMPIKRLREELYKRGVQLTDLAGCLISHEHQDHCKAVKGLLRAGVNCFMSWRTSQKIGPEVHTHHRVIDVFTSCVCCIGLWSIIPFRLEHDAADPVDFLIIHGDESLLFIPDTAYVQNRFEGVTILAVECNHIGDILHENIVNDRIPATVGKRVRRNHMSLQTVIEMLKANDLSRCRQIWLLHLSDANSNEAEMIKTVQEATGVPCYAAGAINK